MSNFTVTTIYTVSTTEIQGLNFDKFRCTMSARFDFVTLFVLHGIVSFFLDLLFLWSDVCNHQRVCRSFQALARL